MFIKRILPHAVGMVILYLIFMLSCSGQPKESRDTIVNKFIAGLKANNEQEIYAISYHMNFKNNITDPDIRKRSVKSASDMIHKYGLPAKNKWITKTDPNGSGISSLVIALFTGGDTATSLTRSTLVLYFPPPNASNKVFDFEIVNTYKSDKSLVAPPRKTN